MYLAIYLLLNHEGEPMFNVLTSVLSSCFWIAFSIAWAELIRDLWHVACHTNPTLYQLFHRWHHIAYTENLEKRSPELWRKAEWRHGVPEASLMLIGSILLWRLPLLDSHSWCTTASFAGVIFSAKLLFFVILRGLGFVTAVDVLHQPRNFEAPPSQWKVNLAYHFKHHSVYLKAYYGAIYTILDQVIGTALSVHHMKVVMTGFSDSWNRILGTELEQAGASVTTNLAEASLQGIDILIIADGNPHLIPPFFSKVKTNRDIACKELWWVQFPGQPALPDWAEREAPCVVRQISIFAHPEIAPEKISRQILFQAKRHIINILVTQDPLLVLLYRLKLLLNQTWDGYVTRRHCYPSVQEQESC